MVFCQTGGGGGAGVSNPTAFLTKYLYQKPFRTSLGPPKHVLHFVWSDSDISRAINISLKLAHLNQFSSIIGNYRRHHKSNKTIDF